MALKKLRKMLGGESEAYEYDYLCQDCETAFRSTSQSTSDVVCPECGSSGPGSIFRG